MKQLSNEKNCKVLAASDVKSKTRETMICRSGFFQGMHGEVQVSKSDLDSMVAKYKEVRGEPQNEFDYAPLLKDHIRATDNVLGRLLVEGLEVRPWKKLKGIQEFGLFGVLRIDDEDALQKVNDGLYANVSVTFDEEFEIIEVSFVAVEAARGSIVLSKGEKKMKKNQKKLAKPASKQTALSLAVTNARTVRAQSLAALSTNVKSLSAQLTELNAQSQSIQLAMKVGQTKNRFVDFIKQGKMNPAEMMKLDIASLSMLPETALSAVLQSYDSRTPSADIYQFGQAASDKNIVTDMSPAKMREAIALQKSGKKTKSLSAEEVPAEKKELSDSEKADMEKMMKSYAMGEDEFKKCLSDMEEISKKVGEIMSKFSAMNTDVEKMSADDEKAKEDEKLAAEKDSEEDEKLAAADDEDEDETKNKEKGE